MSGYICLHVHYLPGIDDGVRALPRAQVLARALEVDMPGARVRAGGTDEGAPRQAQRRFAHALAARCRFADCAHHTEPGCAVREAIEAGELDGRRLESFNKLKREDIVNTESVAERHARMRKFSKTVRYANKVKSKR